MTPWSRRHFLRNLSGLGLAAMGAPGIGARGPSAAASAASPPFGFPRPSERLHGLSSDDTVLRFGPRAMLDALLESTLPPTARQRSWEETGRRLRERFADLSRHFIFEYYPWYASEPFRHWQQWNRVPPIDIAATSMPALGPYDSTARRTIAQHAAWIRETGAGAVNLSWWGPGSFEDRTAHTVMDVMADHDLKVTFHLEPYSDDRNVTYPRDITYLLREFGHRRKWDCFLVLRDAFGREGPVFKSFRTILPEQVTDCHGDVWEVPDYVPDAIWASRLETVREQLRYDFDHITLLADSMNVQRVNRAGFDGCAPYSNFITPDTWRNHAQRAHEQALTFSFNCNAGFDGIARRDVPGGSCYEPTPFLPPAELDWTEQRDRERARRLAQRQINRTFRSSVRLQTDPTFTNWDRGQFLVYINSFNEWHEGTAFEPAKNWGDLSEPEREVGYHNSTRGRYRLAKLKRLLASVLDA